MSSNSAQFLLKEICDLLDTYKGRDKILRTLCYSTKLIGGLTDNPLLAHKWQTFSSQMSATRTVLRLLDDLPMLKYTLEYGLGREEPDKTMATLGFMSNVVDQIFYPIEKMAWLAEHKMLSGYDSKPWDTASSVCWVLSIYFNLCRSLRLLSILRRHQACISNNIDKTNTVNLSTSEKLELLTCLRLLLDLTHAINTLPSGFLWSSKLKTWHIGVIGTASSILGIYQIYAKRALKTNVN